MHDVWRKVDFLGDKNASDARRLCAEMLDRLQSASLFTAQADDDHIRSLLSEWQMPMYRIVFSEINIPLEELKRQRDAIPYDY